MMVAVFACATALALDTAALPMMPVTTPAMAPMMVRVMSQRSTKGGFVLISTSPSAASAVVFMRQAQPDYSHLQPGALRAIPRRNRKVPGAMDHDPRQHIT
jgi:hypothetical protein